MHYMDRKHAERLAGAYRAYLSGTVCVYCGNDAEVSDHFMPVSVAARYEVDPKLKLLVPACAECNGIAHAKIFFTIGAKRRHIQARLREIYSKELAMPEWDREDLEELGWTLRQMVIKRLRTKERTLLRVKWRNAAGARRSLRESEIGKASAAERVVRHTIQIELGELDQLFASK